MMSYLHKQRIGAGKSDKEIWDTYRVKENDDSSPPPIRVMLAAGGV